MTHLGRLEVHIVVADLEKDGNEIDERNIVSAQSWISIGQGHGKSW